MEKTSKLTNVQGNGTFNDLYKFEVTFEDGSNGILYRKTAEPKVEKGQDYTFTINQKGTVKIIPPGGLEQYKNNGSNNYAKVPTSSTSINRDELIVRQVAVKAAVDFCKNNDCSPEEVTSTAQIFRDWIFSEASKDKMQEVGGNDDMPF